MAEATTTKSAKAAVAGDRFPLHRRRRRHRGPRNDVQAMPEMSGQDGADDAAPGE